MSEENIDIMREHTRFFSEEDKANLMNVKRLGNNFYAFLDNLGIDRECREISLAKTKLEEAVMWAVKGITG